MHHSFAFTRLTLWRFFASVILAGVLVGEAAVADEIVADEIVADEIVADEITTDEVTTSQELEKRMVELVDQLGAAGFADRERAAAKLMEMGPSILDPLRTLAEKSSDPEVRDRAEAIVVQMAEGNLQMRIETFLSGGKCTFEGWEEFKDAMADNNVTRDLFIQIMTEHPTLLPSLAGTTRDRMDAVESTIGKIQHRQFIERTFATAADTIALYLPTRDPELPLLAGHESVMLRLLDQEAARVIRRENKLAEPFTKLFAGWTNRATLTNRTETLIKVVQWEIPEALPLAVRTLSEANQTETLAIALQVVSRFGTKKDALAVAPLLGDRRMTAEVGYAGGRLIETKMCDLAIATIAILHDVKLDDVGLKNARNRPNLGFDFREIGFAPDEKEERSKSIEIVKELLDSNKS
ncbi:hypothetical protein N9N28_07835 [Rubripirellula amarantea]|nr:hypothetical protein [Rubripirellula amarantea]